MAKTERLYIRIAPDMKEALQEIAAADGRSLSNYIENLLRREIEQSKKK
jgi:predicted HicB family RNase H-like nuclease